MAIKIPRMGAPGKLPPNIDKALKGTIKSTAKLTGGKRLRAWLREARKKPKTIVDVGFFSSARYQDGTQVAAVAAWNEWGTTRIPQRPFMRNAIGKAKEPVMTAAKQSMDSLEPSVPRRTLERIGAVVQGAIQREITELKNPPNAPVTVELKGSSNPLIDDQHMRKSVTFNVGPGTV